MERQVADPIPVCASMFQNQQLYFNHLGAIHLLKSCIVTSEVTSMVVSILSWNSIIIKICDMWAVGVECVLCAL